MNYHDLERWRARIAEEHRLIKQIENERKKRLTITVAAIIITAVVGLIFLLWII